MESNTNNSTVVDTQANTDTQVNADTQAENTETTGESENNQEQRVDEYKNKLAELEARERAIEIKEKEMQLKELRKESFDILKDKGISEKLHEPISELLNYENRDKCMESIERVTGILSSLLEPLINDRLRGNYTPKNSRITNNNTSKKASTTFESEVNNVKTKIFN
ncbi:hypothetical protein ACSXAY_14240 [Clostridium perfringens]